MSRTRVDDLHKDWMKDPKYRREYHALEEEFSLTAAMIEARSRAGMTQEQVARRMKTTQAAIARLESKGSRPSTSEVFDLKPTSKRPQRFVKSENGNHPGTA